MATRQLLLLDVMVGTLATYLRMCGYDAAYALDRAVEADEELLAWADREGRLILTRDAELARRADRAILLRSLDVTDQLRELASAGFELSLSESSRCANCNGELRQVGHGEETPDYAQIPAKASSGYGSVYTVGRTSRRGSHWADVERTLEQIESAQR